ncbi:RIP metalloprotease RseP [Mucilaginibacter sp. MD40]|uniref:RIP metalloprotease RseP n=1 Tax=Mucilaginibacter sp. MD40 TaxID=2029590 RepID=UPI001E542C34|nr:RIP metalloprotease RseP [Mucilaginibacter sp. MD40]
MIAQFILGISILVTVHELGHFIAARAFGIRVEKFYLFFDAWGLSLVKFKKNGTEYGIGWLPLGGYIKMTGLHEIDDEEDGSRSNEQAGSFSSKPAWQRLIVMSGGVLLNLILAVLIFSVQTAIYGKDYIRKLKTDYEILPGEIGLKAGLLPGDKVVALDGDSVFYQDELLSTRILKGNTILTVIRTKANEKVHMHLKISPEIMRLLADKAPTEFFRMGTIFKFDSIYTNSDLKTAGIQKNDRVTELDGKPLNFYEDFLVRLQKNKKKQIQLTVIHDGKASQVIAHKDKDGHFGFSLQAIHPQMKPVEISVPQNLSYGAGRAWSAFSDNGLNDILSGRIKVADAVTGPIGIAVLFGGSFDWPRFWRLLAVLSTAIAFFNLLPLPVLDGGQAFFIGIEAIRGKPISTTITAYLQISGLVILALLAIYVCFIDIIRLVNI